MTKFKLNIHGEGLTLEKDIESEVANKIIALLFSSNPSLTSNTESSSDIAAPRRKAAHKHSKRIFTDQTSVRPEVENMELTPVVNGYKSYHDDLKTKADKALWILAQAKENGLDEINSSELSRLARKVNDNIAAKNVKGILVAHSNKGRLYMDTKGGVLRLRILEEGLRYLKNV